MDIPPLFLRKRTGQTIPTCFKSEDPSVTNEQIMEFNIKDDILNQITAERERNRKLFPSRPLMGYSWCKWEGRGQESYGAEDKLYRNIRNTPPSIYGPYSFDSSKEPDPTRRNRNRHFPSLRRNLGCQEMKPPVPSFWNSGSAKPPLPLLSPYPCSSCVTEPKTNPGTTGIEKHRPQRGLPFSGVRDSSKSVSRKKESGVSLSAAERLESASKNNVFWVKGESLKQNVRSYIPSSSVSHNEYMAHFQSYSDESDED